MRGYDMSEIIPVIKLYGEHQNLCATTGTDCKCKIKRQDFLMPHATELTTTSKELPKK
jgi:hypothetical protein